MCLTNHEARLGQGAAIGRLFLQIAFNSLKILVQKLSCAFHNGVWIQAVCSENSLKEGSLVRILILVCNEQALWIFAAPFFPSLILSPVYHFYADY